MLLEFLAIIGIIVFIFGGYVFIRILDEIRGQLHNITIVLDKINKSL